MTGAHSAGPQPSTRGGVPIWLILIGKIYLSKFLGHDRAAAEDVAQQTWLRVHTSHETFKRGSKVRPWLFSIAANLAMDAQRVQNGRGETRRFTHSFSGLLGDRDFDPADLHAEAASEAADRAEMLVLVRQVLCGLSERYRVPVELVYIEGLTFSEAASRLGIPLPSLKTRIYRALHAMRHSLCAGDDGPDAEVA